jgi:regulator of sigma E protease
MVTVLAFLLSIGILVTVHEWGHFQMARTCGVRVLKFSVGFGPALWTWKSARSQTEYTLGMLPLGGYVKMLDEREAPVDPNELAFAFNVQPLRKKAAIVAAGPTANIVLAVMLYAVVNWIGVMEPQARISRPAEHSIAASAGLRGGEWIRLAGFDADSMTEVASYEDLRWWLTRAALESRNLHLQYEGPDAAPAASAVLKFDDFHPKQADETMFRAIGLAGPYSPATVGDVMEGSAASDAGLLSGDKVVKVNETTISDAAQLRDLIRASGRSAAPVLQQWLVLRGSEQMLLNMTPRRESDAGGSIGRVGAVIGEMPSTTLVRSGPWAGLTKAIGRTWEVSALTVRMMGQIATGQASLKNLSGPITIADYAGRSASLGVTPFLVFLALISISLGVLNLLPLPALDGGHLMYYLWEGSTGREISDAWMAGLQRAGFAILMVMMSVALFNDLYRLLS